MKWQVSQKPFKVDAKILMTELCKLVSTNSKWHGKVAQDILFLKLEGYFTFENIPEHDMLVQITNKGISALSGQYFLKKHRDFIYKLFYDALLLFCNVAVAIAAIIALRKDDSQIEALQSRLTKVENLILRDTTPKHEDNPPVPNLPNIDSNALKKSTTLGDTIKLKR